MDTETVADTEADSGNISRHTRNAHTTPGRVGRKISNVLQAFDAFKDVGHQRVYRKISTTLSRNYSDERGQAAKMNKCGQGKLENTYKLEPDKSFPHAAVREIIADALHRHLDGMNYDQKESRYKVKLISEDIKAKVKGLNTDRYKVICLVHVGCDTGQKLDFVSRALWSPQTDTFATSYFRSGNLFAVGTVYGVYYE